MITSRVTRSTTLARLNHTRASLMVQTRCLSHTPHPEASHNEIKELPKSYNHYQILGIDSTADSKAVKTAFRKLSKRFHPDVNQRVPTALKPIIKNNYIRIVSSYETLSDATKRRAYDSTLSIRPPQGPRFTDHTQQYSPSSKAYSPGGINITRNKVHYGAGYRRSRNRYSHLDSQINGSNYDVPHFDYDTHLKGNLWFERRMISKKLMKTSSAVEEKTNEWFNEKFQNHNKRTLEAEMNDTLNLQRYGGHYHRGQASFSITAGPLMLTGLTILTMGLYLH